MSDLEIVKSYYQAFNDGNWERMLTFVADDIRHEPNQGDVRIGKELFSSFLKHMDTCYEENLRDMVFFTGDQHGRFSVEFVVHGVYKKGETGLPEANGQAYVLPAAAFLEVKNGKIQRLTTYYNLEWWVKMVSQ